jgi:hypothetical protein
MPQGHELIEYRKTRTEAGSCAVCDHNFDAMRTRLAFQSVFRCLPTVPNLIWSESQ